MPDIRKILVNGTPYEVEVLLQSRAKVCFNILGRTYEVGYQEKLAEISEIKSKTQHADRQLNRINKPSAGEILSPIPGVIIDLLVKTGDLVKHGAILLKIEAMKMENNIFAPYDGEVSEILVQKDQEISDGQLLIRLTGLPK